MLAAAGNWLILALLLPGLIVLIGVVLAFALERRKGPGRPDPSAPAPGYYLVLGIDDKNGAARQATFHADSESGARGRATMDGIVVTEIRRVEETDR